MYLIDGFQTTSQKINCKKVHNEIIVREANLDDVMDIHNLLIEFNRYYRSAPLFLNREIESVEEIGNLITNPNSVIFIGEVNKTIIGIIDVVIVDEKNKITLTDNIWDNF